MFIGRKWNYHKKWSWRLQLRLILIKGRERRAEKKSNISFKSKIPNHWVELNWKAMPLNVISFFNVSFLSSTNQIELKKKTETEKIKHGKIFILKCHLSGAKCEWNAEWSAPNQNGSSHWGFFFLSLSRFLSINLFTYQFVTITKDANDIYFRISFWIHIRGFFPISILFINIHNWIGNWKLKKKSFFFVTILFVPDLSSKTYTSPFFFSLEAQFHWFEFGAYFLPAE